MFERTAHRLLGRFWLLALPLSACAAAPHAHSGPTTQPGQGDGSLHLRLSDAVPLQTLTPPGWVANLTDKLDSPAAVTTYFGELDDFDDDDDADKPSDTVPIIARKGDDGGWTAVALLGGRFAEDGWRYVAAGPGPREIWAALDSVTDDDRSSFFLAHSTDGGQSFQMSAIRKPCKLAAFYDFVMSRDGHGRASLSLDADCGPHKAGVYHYETGDDGRSWSTTPRYEPDAMIRSDTVGDDEQPDAGPGTPQRSSLRAPERGLVRPARWAARSR